MSKKKGKNNHFKISVIERFNVLKSIFKRFFLSSYQIEIIYKVFHYLIFV